MCFFDTVQNERTNCQKALSVVRISTGDQEHDVGTVTCIDVLLRNEVTLTNLMKCHLRSNDLSVLDGPRESKDK